MTQVKKSSPADRKADTIRKIKKNLEILRNVKIYSEKWKRRESTLVDLLLNCGLSDKEKEVFGKQYDKIEGTAAIPVYAQAKPNPCYS